jgi:hypothetical protein
MKRPEFIDADKLQVPEITPVGDRYRETTDYMWVRPVDRGSAK